MLILDEGDVAADLTLNRFWKNVGSYFVAELFCIMNPLYSLVQEKISFWMLTSMKGDGGLLVQKVVKSI